MRAKQIATLVTSVIGVGVIVLFGYQAVSATLKIKSGSGQPTQEMVGEAPGNVKKAEKQVYVPAYQWYPVAKVTDGDTLSIRNGDKTVSIRLIGVDTPEMAEPRECFAKEATDEAQKLLGGSSVRIETDPTQNLYDSYGRLLAYVYVPTSANPDGVLVNEYLISGGYGREYTFKGIAYKYQDDFKSAEAAARELKRGMWTACGGA
ncbi:MAG: thermonuclease family protein [Candidatus Kaiserbacteria bacterium]|nr:MAG: thermonuclease family protein [Candidatus Kaiserbacteria bacterium]